jgi:hypothetical protein
MPKPGQLGRANWVLIFAKGQVHSSHKVRPRVHGVTDVSVRFEFGKSHGNRMARAWTASTCYPIGDAV